VLCSNHECNRVPSRYEHCPPRYQTRKCLSPPQQTYAVPGQACAIDSDAAPFRPPAQVLYATPANDSPIKLADFGFGKMTNVDGEAMSTMCGTPTFVAPEVIASEVRQGSAISYDKACDVWSAGVLLFCMLSGAARAPPRPRPRPLSAPLAPASS
jgi:serine/threonine protein kinase